MPILNAITNKDTGGSVLSTEAQHDSLPNVITNVGIGGSSLATMAQRLNSIANVSLGVSILSTMSQHDSLPNPITNKGTGGSVLSGLRQFTNPITNRDTGGSVLSTQVQIPNPIVISSGSVLSTFAQFFLLNGSVLSSFAQHYNPIVNIAGGGSVLSTFNYLIGVGSPATTYTFTGPTTLTAGTNGTYFLTGNGATTAPITISDGGGGGVITTSPVSLNNTSSVTFLYSNTTPGTYTLTPSNSSGLTDPSPIVVVVTGTGGSNIPVSGHLSRADYGYPGATGTVPGTGPGTPRKTTNISIIISVYDPHVTNTITCTCSGVPYTFTYTPGVATLTSVTTDCNGDFSFSVPPSTGTNVVNAIVSIGKITNNPLWTGNICTDFCSGEPQFLDPAPGYDPREQQGGTSLNIINGTFPVIATGTAGFNEWNTASGFVNITLDGTGTPITGMTLNLNMGGGGGGATQIGSIYIMVKKGTKYYLVNNASITLTDTCGASNTATGGSLGFGGPTWTDWKLWNSLTINSGIPPDCGYDTNSNLTLLTPVPSSIDYMTHGTTLPTITKPYFTNFQWGIIIQECPESLYAATLQADTNNNVINMVWQNPANVLHARHLNPSKYIGSGSTGWEANQMISGMVPYPGCLYLSGDDFVILAGPTSVSHSSGDPGSFSTFVPTISNRSAGSVGREVRSAYQFSILLPFNPATPLTTGQILFNQYVKPDGTQSFGSTIDVGCVGPRVGGYWNGDGWTALATLSVSGVEGTYTWTSSNGRTWSTRSSVISTIVDRVCSLVRTKGDNCFVGLTYSPSTFQCKAIRSYDNGVTWEQDSSYISAIPATLTPPMLVPMQDGLYACWQDADVPKFAYSGDAGKTWI